MQTTRHQDILLTRFQRHCRVCILTPFGCSRCRLDGQHTGWFQERYQSAGMVYDLSLRGTRVAVQGVMLQKGLATVPLQFPKQIVPAKLPATTGCWVKGQICGLMG